MDLGKSGILHVAIAVALTSTAHDAARADVTTTISGFGTVGGSFTSDASYAYRHNATEFQGASSNMDIGLESRVGVQAVFDFGAGFSATVQELAKQRGGRNFDPGTEWLYVQYAPMTDLKLRIGRVALGTFYYSDSREVGYAAPWFAAPNTVYGAEPFEYLDGGQILWHLDFGPYRFNLQSSYGTTQATFLIQGMTSTVAAHDAFNASVELQYGNLQFRISQTNVIVPVTLPLSPISSVIYNNHDNFTSFGLQYDDGRAIAITEWSKRSENSAPVFGKPLTPSKQWYIAGGWRVGPFTPLAIVSGAQPEASLSATPANFHSFALSLRYDVIANVALKTQVTRAPAADTSYWVLASPTSSQHVNVYSVGADFIF